MKRDVLLCRAGLPGEHVLASGVARPSSQLHGAAQQNRGGETRTRRLEHDLDPGHVPAKRKRRQVSQSHRAESLVEVKSGWGLVVRYQVSKDLHRTHI